MESFRRLNVLTHVLNGREARQRAPHEKAVELGSVALNDLWQKLGGPTGQDVEMQQVIDITMVNIIVGGNKLVLEGIDHVHDKGPLKNLRLQRIYSEFARYKRMSNYLTDAGKLEMAIFFAEVRRSIRLGVESEFNPEDAAEKKRREVACTAAINLLIYPKE